MLVRLSGGCFAPVGILARVAGGLLRVHARIVSLDGTRRAEAAIQGAPGAGPVLMHTLADRLIAAGAADIIAETREKLQGAGK
jgi:hydroxymethylbilane synthase